MDLNNINVNEVENMQTAIKNYKAGVEDSLSKLFHKIEYANAFKGSSIAEVIKGYLESMVTELQKVTTYVSELDQTLDSKKEVVEEKPVEVELTPATVSDGIDV